MATIRETDLMVVCVEVAKIMGRNYNQEVTDAADRICKAMFDSKMDGSEVTVTKVENNPVDRDVANRMLSTTIRFVLGLED